ncbi:hypothetical protein F2981_22865 (plasmid) [Sinorhizobium meliloti]|nr:hypothetical protein [Sinorhizobium meliloti]
MPGKTSDASEQLVQLRELEQKAAALKTALRILSRPLRNRRRSSNPSRSPRRRVISEAGVPVSPSSPKKTDDSPRFGRARMMVAGLTRPSCEFANGLSAWKATSARSLGHRSLGYVPLLGTRMKKKAQLVHAHSAR